MRLGRAQYHQIARLRGAILDAGHDERTMISIVCSVEDDTADLTRDQWNARVKRVTERIAAGERPLVTVDPERPGLSGVFLGFAPKEQER